MQVNIDGFYASVASDPSKFSILRFSNCVANTDFPRDYSSIFSTRKYSE